MFSIEQQIVKYLADTGQIIDLTLARAAMKDEPVAEALVGGDLDEAMDCDHEAATQSDIDVVFQAGVIGEDETEESKKGIEM